MALLERVGTLLRANLNDLIDKAEDPEKMMKQLMLDMENQLMQVKTQVAIAIADEHLLEKKRKDHETSEADWKRKAELAVRKGDDALARAALERVLSSRQMAASFTQQVEDQRVEVDTLKTALRRLEQKLQETRSRCEVLIAEHRRAKTVGRAQAAREAIGKADRSVSIDRMKARVDSAEAHNAASREMMEGESLENRFAALEREEHIDSLLRDLKDQHTKSA
jgi:phage shock protein A